MLCSMSVAEKYNSSYTVTSSLLQPKKSFNSSDSSSITLNENGWNGQPPNSANLENDSTQARRSECNMALVPSMAMRMAQARNN